MCIMATNDSLSPKERYDAEKREKELTRQSTPQGGGKRGGRTIFGWAAALIVLGGLGYWLFSVVMENSPRGEDFSVSYPIVGQDHITEDSPRPTTYNSNPPTSGPHYATPARVGFYEKQFPDERLIHNLEHGDVWISYRSEVSTSTRNALVPLAGTKVIITLRPENEWDIAVTAWGRLDTFNLAGDNINALELQRIKDFILRYQNQSPEKVLNTDDRLPS